MSRWSSLAASFVLIAGCAGPASKPPDAAAAPAAAAPVLPPSGVMLANFDRNVRPVDDLYRFVNGAWLARTEIPADRSNYGSFSKLADDVETNLRAIAEEAAASTAAAGTEQRMIGDFYSSFMDEARVEQLGLTPLDAELRRIDAIKGRTALVDYLSHLQILGINNPIAMAIQPDAKRPDVYTIYADQAGLGMPDRDYFLSDDAKFVAMRDKYHKYVVDLLALTGHKDATGAATKVVALETRLARAQWPNVDLRNVDKVYNPFDLAGAGKLTPAIDWPRYLEMMGVADHDSVIVGEPSYFEELSRAFGDVPLAVWRDYLRVRVVDDLAPYLNAAVVERSFDFNGRTLHGHAARSGRAGSARWARPKPRSASCWARSTSSATSRPRPRRAWTSWSPTCSPRSPPRSTSSTGWAAETRSEAQDEARQLHGQDRLPGQVARLLRARDRAATTWSATCCARARSIVSRERRASSASRSTDRVGHDAADGQRLLQPARPTRSCSRPRSCSRRSST